MGVNKFNYEGYYDPTTYEALTKIKQKAKALRAFRPVVYICSPLAGDMVKNQEIARTCCCCAVDPGAYETKTSLSRAKLSHLMDTETWMNANKTVELGFADGLLFKADGESAVAENSFVFIGSVKVFL